MRYYLIDILSSSWPSALTVVEATVCRDLSWKRLCDRTGAPRWGVQDAATPVPPSPTETALGSLLESCPYPKHSDKATYINLIEVNKARPSYDKKFQKYIFHFSSFPFSRSLPAISDWKHSCVQPQTYGCVHTADFLCGIGCSFGTVLENQRGIHILRYIHMASERKKRVQFHIKNSHVNPAQYFPQMRFAEIVSDTL